MKLKNWFFVYFLMVNGVANAQTEQPFVQSGYEKHVKGEFLSALEDYSKALVINPNNLDALYNRGVCRLAVNFLDSAKVDFDRTLQLNKTHALAFYNRATILVIQNDYEAALMDANSAILNDKNMAAAYVLRGQLLLRANDSAAACNDFQEAKRLQDPEADRYLLQYCKK